MIHKWAIAKLCFPTAPDDEDEMILKMASATPSGFSCTACNERQGPQFHQSVLRNGGALTRCPQCATTENDAMTRPWFTSHINLRDSSDLNIFQYYAANPEICNGPRTPFLGVPQTQNEPDIVSIAGLRVSPPAHGRRRNRSRPLGFSGTWA